MDTISTGCGLPALYNEEEYVRALQNAEIGIREEDLVWHNSGGCTETMIHGRFNVGSLDAGINLPLILAQTLHERLSTTANFEAFVEVYKADVAEVVREIVDDVNANQEMKSRPRPQPMRSLLIDDCIEVGRESNNGGARYNWSVINMAGFANVVYSLAAVQEVVFEKKEKTSAAFLGILGNNYEGEETFRHRLSRCPQFGNDNSMSDNIAADIAAFVFQGFLRYTAWRGGKFLASCLMFVTYESAGTPVTATPDGRLDREPLRSRSLPGTRSQRPNSDAQKCNVDSARPGTGNARRQHTFHKGFLQDGRRSCEIKTSDSDILRLGRDAASDQCRRSRGSAGCYRASRAARRSDRSHWRVLRVFQSPVANSQTDCAGTHGTQSVSRKTARIGFSKKFITWR